MYEIYPRLLFLIIGLTGVTINSCQPPSLGLYNAYSQYSSQQQPSQSQIYQQQHQHQQKYQPPFDASAATGDSVNQNTVLSAPIPPPSQSSASSFLQDITPEDEIAAFESNSIIPISTPMPNSPPQDPPANPFIGDSSKHEINEEKLTELYQNLTMKCSINGVANVRDFLDCTDGAPYSVTPMLAKFGSNKCDFEPEFVCRFYSSPQESLQFKSGQPRINSKTSKVFEETFGILTKRPPGNYPDGSFIYLDVPRQSIPSASASAVLKTDVLCQNGDGKLSFDYWSSSNFIELKVCTSDEKERSCTQDIPYDMVASRIEVDVIHPESAQFSLEIVISNFTESTIFIIDNLDFDAKLCEDSLLASGAEPSNHLLPSTPTTSGIEPLNDIVHLPPPMPAQRNQAFGSQIEHTFLSLPDQGFQPLNQASYRQNYAIPVSTLSPYPGAYVTPPTPQYQNFQPYIPSPRPATPVLNTFKINPSPNPLQYSHQGFPIGSANNSEITPGVAFVQNRYSQAPNDKQSFLNNRFPEAPKQMKLVPKLPIRKVTACDMLSCKFNSNFCQWKSPKYNIMGARTSKWQFGRSHIGNPHTGIKSYGHGGFAYVGMNESPSPKIKGRTVYILESPQFSLQNDTLLSFDFYRRSNAITLQVCLDSVANCPYQNDPKLNPNIYWKEGESVLLPAKTKKVYFVATLWKRQKYLAIDNIVLNKGLGCDAGIRAKNNNRIL